MMVRAMLPVRKENESESEEASCAAPSFVRERLSRVPPRLRDMASANWEPVLSCGVCPGSF